MRKQGWYWVKPSADEPWEVAEWIGGTWEVTRADHDWPEQMIEVVGPRIPTPDEPWQCVPVEPTREMLEATGDKSADAYSGMLGAWTLMLNSAPKPESQP